ncbi:chorismate mutase [Azorhizobium doebereinerae]|uniref:chorismate mutase n=1 Tax=Azorhizobium doebereinerae TaxID=281091 RepID=UPI0031585D98
MGGVSAEHEEAARRLLKEARVEIDAIDAQMVDLLAARLAVVERVLAIKKEAGLPALLPDRVEDVVARVRERAVSSEVPADLVEALWRFLIQWTIEYEDARLG